MGGEKKSDYKKAYKMLSDGYSMKDTAQEIRLHIADMTEQQLRNILMRSTKLWIKNNRQKLEWAYATNRRRYIRFSSDPFIMLLQVAALLITAAIRTTFNEIEKHQTEKCISSLSEELNSMADFAETKARRRYKQEEKQAYKRELEPLNPLIEHALEISERSR